MMQRLRHIILVLLTFFLVELGTHVTMNPNSRFAYPRNTRPIKIYDGYLYCDSLKLPIHEIPKVEQLHFIATQMMGKWNRLFTAIKIEESGHDGQHSFNAREYYNLTGMRFPQKRKTTAIRRGKGYYAVYVNWYEGMLDFKYYLDYMEGSFYRKYQRFPTNEIEFINHIYGSFNVYSKWKQDVFTILKRHPLLVSK